MNRAAILLLAISMPEAARAAADDEFFEKRVRPALAEHCFECHGEKKQKGGLRLDSRAAAMAGGDLGAALVPGDIEKSLLLKAISYTDEDLQMPPKKRLPAALVADLTEWVQRGATWPGDDKQVVKTGGPMQFTEEMKMHWAFQPLHQPAVPQPKDAAWCKTDIDRFILARLEAVGIPPAPSADARTLVRRLSFDLIGLPPTMEEADSFTTDKVDVRVAELLASPHYGERWGRHWLDVARYADSVGSEVDHAMANAWRYRDYVVRAFNTDKPYDQFVREQIAADLLPGVNADTLPATGLLVLGPKALAGLDKAQLIADVVDEQLDTVSRAFMGLTMGCARCHDHKFDPLPTADYYAFAGIFQSTRTVDTSKRVATWTERPLGGPEDLARYDELEKKVAVLRVAREEVSKQLATTKPAAAASKGDRRVLVIEAEDFTRANVRVENKLLGKGIGVVRTRMEYPDRIEYDFELPEAGEYQLEFRYAAKESRPTQLSINGNLEEMEAAAEVTGDWGPKAQRWFRQGVYRFLEGKNVLTFHRDGPVPLFDKWLIGPVLPDGQKHSDALSRASGIAKVAPEEAGKKKRLKELDAEISAVEDELEKIPSALAAYEGVVADVPILIRGNPAAPGAVIARGFPRIVSGIAEQKPGPLQSGRLELAHWLTQPNHPLTARVIVNRVWHWHFGEGLVRSPDNFGLRGERPSHPELLDWLASWFVENGWSLKRLHTLICTSAVYQQSALPQAPAGDPENVLLSHWSRSRLEAEQLRDAMLAVSGRLDRTVGGTLMNVLNRTYANGGNAPPDIVKKMNYDSPRRSIYLPIIRNALHDFFAIFDYPDPGMLTGRRAQTTVAPQALFLMNSAFVRDQAHAFAQRVQSLGSDDSARLIAAYKLAFARPPRPVEIQSALDFLANEEHIQQLNGDPSAGQTAWVRLCHTLLAANEFLYLR